VTAAACVLHQPRRRAVRSSRGARRSAAQRNPISGRQHSLVTVAAHASDSPHSVTSHLCAATVGKRHTASSSDRNSASLHSMQLLDNFGVREERMHAAPAASAASSKHQRHEQAGRRSQLTCRSLHSRSRCTLSLNRRRTSNTSGQRFSAAPRAVGSAPAPEHSAIAMAPAPVGRMASSKPANDWQKGPQPRHRLCRAACCCESSRRPSQQKSRTAPRQRLDSRTARALDARDHARVWPGAIGGQAARRPCMRRSAGPALCHRRWCLVERVPGAGACC